MIRKLLMILMLLTSVHAHAQHKIKLKSGKVIKEARLFREAPMSITYERRYSLHDLEKSKIEYIETDSSFIRFDQNGRRMTQWKWNYSRSRGSSQENNEEEEHEDISAYRTIDPDSSKGSAVTETERPNYTPYRNPNKAGTRWLARRNVNLTVSWLAAGAAGLAGGIVGVIPGAIIGWGVDQPEVGSWTGFAIGGALGAASGAYAIGEAAYGSGGAGAAILGSMVGAAAGATFVGLAYETQNDLYYFPAMLLPATGAVIGYRLYIDKKQESDLGLSVMPTGNGLAMTLTF